MSLHRIAIAAALIMMCGAAAVVAAENPTLLPDGWRISAPVGPAVAVDTMPQGIALSPDGAQLAVVESGVNKPALRLLPSASLQPAVTIPLGGTFGTPVWRDAWHVLVAGANADALFDVDVNAKTGRAIALTKNSWPNAVALSSDGRHVALANDGNATVTIGTLPDLTDKVDIQTEPHPGGLVFSRDGKTLYVALRNGRNVAAIDVASHAIVKSIETGLHPTALALSRDGSQLLVAEADDDAVGVVDTRTNTLALTVDVGLVLHEPGASSSSAIPGASPNGFAVHGGDVFVSLGAENAVALIRNGKVIERIPAGWYPTGVAVGNDGTLFVSNGKGEGSPANPLYDPRKRGSVGYVAAITVGSVRAIPASDYADADAVTQQVLANANAQWAPPPDDQTVIRSDGPIRHVIYIIKENRTYDQVLGDISGANGDPNLAWFGRRVTPNEHAIAQRFGVFDNAYANAQVSADGHNWTDAGFGNDYLERFWPPNYGGRRRLYDFESGLSPTAPHNGYLWDAAKRAGITYRDYGEDTTEDAPPVKTDHVALQDHVDTAFEGWNLQYKESDRFKEWQREFKQFVANDNLPQLEIVRFPNDHTAGTRPGSLTPDAYVASNDQAVGALVEAVSHSKYWSSTAIFVLEDDAQNGPDHVSAQRSTFYIASPYARGGVVHAHYSTTSFLHTMELILGLQPLSTYDAMALPLYDAFGTQPTNGKPYSLIAPSVDLSAVNSPNAYGANVSAHMNFTHEDEVDPRVMNDILAHAVGKRR